MAVRLHEGARKRLFELLQETLPQVQYEHGKHLVTSTLAPLAKLDEVLSARSDTFRDLVTYIGDEPISGFVMSRLHEDMGGAEYLADANPQPITAHPALADAPALAERLLVDLEQLPTRYAFFVRVPDSVAALLRDVLAGSSFDLSTVHALVWGDGTEAEFPEGTTGGTLLTIGSAVRLQAGSLYFRKFASGFDAQLLMTAPKRDFLADVRALFGLLIAERIVTPGAGSEDSSGSFIGIFPTQLQVITYSSRSEAWDFRGASPAGGTELAQVVKGLGPNSRLEEVERPNRGLFKVKALHHVRAAFSRRDVSESILRGAEWLLDSHIINDPILSYVRAAVTLEILLGDKATSDLMGLGQLLANRCAYLIGTSRQDRDRFLEDFKRLYNTRSKIVHAGQRRLNNSELGDLALLQWMCTRVIQEECQLLLADPVPVPQAAVS